MTSTVFVDGQTLIEASWLQDVNDVVYNPGTITASSIANVPNGNIVATDVQAAIDELDTEKQIASSKLTDIAALAVTDGNIIVGNGTTWVAEAGATARASLGLTIGTNVMSHVAPGTDGNILTSDGAGNWVSEALPVSAQKLVQVQYSAIGAATGTSGIPYDNTTPTSSEGTQIASLSITPTSASNKIEITASFLGGTSDTTVNGTPTLIAALFRGTTCIAVTTIYQLGVTYASSIEGSLTFNIIDNPATTSATTYSIRVGKGGGSSWWVGQSVSANFNGMTDNNMIILKELAI